MTGTDLIASWSAWMRAGATPETTITVQTYYVTRLAMDHPHIALSAMTSADLAGWIGGHDWSPNTRKSARSALRKFYAWMELAGQLEVSPATVLPSIRVPRGIPHPTPEAAYVQALSTAEPRVRLAILLAAQSGLRRGEVARVHTNDLEESVGGWSLRVTGKGGHRRLVPLPPQLVELLQASPPGWVFPSPAGGHLTPHHIAKLVARLLPLGYSTHSLRHRCATTAYGATRDLRAVQELLGHSRPETTANYVQLPDDAVRAAMMAAAEMPS